MRYLAVVQRKRFLGQQELQLLAKELGEYSWNAAQGEISSDAVSRFSPGTLVIAEINNGNQIQRIEDAGDHLVALLQSFSRFSESFKAQAEEIESWKQSLIYQSQELSRREAELLVRAQELELQLAQLGALAPEEAMTIRRAAEGDRNLSPSVFQAEQDWLHQREQNIEVMELQLTERQRELDLQFERLTAQQADLQREREALQQQWEKHQQVGLSAEQIGRIQTYLHSLCAEGTPADDEQHRTLAGDRQQYDQEATALAREAAYLSEREREADITWQQWQLRQAGLDAALRALQEEAQRLQQLQSLIEALAASCEPVIPAGRVTPGGESIELLQRQLRDQQREYQQRASLVLQQEEELHAQQTHMRELQQRLATANGSLGAEERQELLEDLEFHEQGCLILSESLSQQQQRLAIEQEKIDQQVAKLSALVGSFDSNAGERERHLERLQEHLRTSLSAQRQRQEQLEREQAEQERSRQALDRTRQELTEARQQLERREQAHREHGERLQALQHDFERRLWQQQQTGPLVSELEALLLQQLQPH